jgi:hypothetical protein
MLTSYDEYAAFLATLQERFGSIQNIKFNAYRTSATRASSSGTIILPKEITLKFNEMINFAKKKLVDYGYVVHHAGEKLYYYDSQPHPDVPSLASTHPHHKHIPPDLKHHRIPAPGLSFDRSNLEFLIREIETTLLS